MSKTGRPGTAIVSSCYNSFQNQISITSNADWQHVWNPPSATRDARIDRSGQLRLISKLPIAVTRSEENENTRHHQHQRSVEEKLARAFCVDEPAVQIRE